MSKFTVEAKWNDDELELIVSGVELVEPGYPFALALHARQVVAAMVDVIAIAFEAGQEDGDEES